MALWGSPQTTSVVTEMIVEDSILWVKVLLHPVILHKLMNFNAALPAYLHAKVDLAVQSNLSLLWHMLSMHIQCFWQLMKAVFTQAVVLFHSMVWAVCVLSLTMPNSLQAQPQARREEKNRFMMHTHLLWQSQKDIMHFFKYCIYLYLSLILLSWRAGVYKSPNGHTGGSLVTNM